MPSSHPVTPKKRFGQHFLVQESAIRGIVGEALDAPAAALLEIGPGPGVLTTGLLQDGRPLHALELDPEACAHLQARFRDCQAFHLHPGDAVRLQLPEADSWSVVGNLPYNAATAILTRFLVEPIPWIRMVLMFQREVGDKLLGPPSSKAYGPLTVLAQLCCGLRRLLRLGPGAFDPPPKVDSVVLRFDPRADAPPIAERKDLLAFLHRSFSQRRKTLLNNWSGAPEAARLAAELARLGLPAAVRAEALPPPQLWALHQACRPS